jgi:hypothetical protein
MFEFDAEYFHLSDESQLLLAIATQKWLVEVENNSSLKYHSPLVELSLYIERAFSGIPLYDSNSDEVIAAIKKINDHIHEKYGHLMQKDVRGSENTESEQESINQ